MTGPASRARFRLLPRSLVGQIVVVMALALLVAQSINFALLLVERQRLSVAQIEGPAIFRFVSMAERFVNLPAEERVQAARRASRRASYAVGPHSIVPPERDVPRISERLRQIAEQNGISVREARAQVSDALPPPRRPLPPELEQARERRLQALILSIRLDDGSWINGRIATLRPNPWLAVRLALSTLLLYLVVLAAMIWIAVRLARPLRDLTMAARGFAGRGEAPQVEPRGPADVQRAILAFNAMGARVGAMLEEKDRMLGAIGHDLRTPLASLRIRAETVEPAEEREKMIATIEEMTAMLDDTLALARSGRSQEAPRPIDLWALADALVEEFRAMGQPVEMEGRSRQIVEVRPNLLRRALRNLIENGVKYGGSVAVRVSGDDETAEIAVLDQGPGIPPDQLERVPEPFYRIEGSRSRETGGSGLGLTLARAAVQIHGGELVLRNRNGGGLEALIRLPRSS